MRQGILLDTEGMQEPEKGTKEDQGGNVKGCGEPADACKQNDSS